MKGKREIDTAITKLGARLHCDEMNFRDYLIKCECGTTVCITLFKTKMSDGDPIMVVGHGGKRNQCDLVPVVTAKLSAVVAEAKGVTDAP